MFDIDPNLAELRNLKEKYIRFNKQFGGKHTEASDRLQYIIEDYRNSTYPMFHRITESLTYHRQAIVNSFIMVERHLKDDAHIKDFPTVLQEALNRIVKDMKRNGRGYQNFSHLRNRFLFSREKMQQYLVFPKHSRKCQIQRTNPEDHTRKKNNGSQ